MAKVNVLTWRLAGEDAGEATGAEVAALDDRDWLGEPPEGGAEQETSNSPAAAMTNAEPVKPEPVKRVIPERVNAERVTAELSIGMSGC